MTHRTVFKEQGVYASFPALYQLPDGALATSFATRTRASHIDPTGGSATMLSTDAGVSWHPTDCTIVNPTYDDGNGRLATAEAYGWRYTDPGERDSLEARGIEVRDVPDGSIGYAHGCYSKLSVDGAASWRTRDLNVPQHALMMSFHDTATFLRYDDRLIMRLVYIRPEAGRRYYELWLLRSEDNGHSWAVVSVAADADCLIGYGESAILRCTDGDLLCVMRTESPSGTRERMAMTRSADTGLTWSTPEMTEMHGHPPDLLRLRDGRIVCTFGYRSDPMGIRAQISEDDGRTFTEDSLVVLRDDGKPSAEGGRGADLGYPITIQLPDDSLMTIYYMTCEDGVTHIATTHWAI